MASLSEIIRKKFLSSVQEASTYGHKLKRVIMDHESYSLYLRVLPSEALLDYNIVDISLIDLHTNCQETIESNKGFIGIYFLFSIDKSFNMLFEQFPMNNESVFTKAHLFFLGVIPPIRFSQLAKRADKYWLSLKELNIDYYPLEPNLFSFNLKDSFLINYSQKKEYIDKKLSFVNDISNKLYSLCITLGHNPIIQYSKTKNSITEEISKKLRYELDNYIIENPEFPPIMNPNKGVNGNTSLFHFPRPKLLILDRLMDVFPLLLADGNYQSILHETEKVEDNVYKGEEEDQSIYLNHTELMINKLKDMKLAQVETYLSKKKKSYQLKLQQNQLTTKNNQLPIENMKKLIININEFKLEKGSLEFNIKLLKNSIKWKNSIKLDEFIKLQKKLFKEKSLDLDSLLLYFCNSKINNQFKFRLFLILVYYLYLNHYKNSYSQENNNNNNNLMDLNTFLTFNNFNHLLHFFPLNEKQFCILTNFYNLLISNNINNNDITNINTDATTTDNKDEIKDNNNNTLLQEYFLLIEQWLKENIPTEINLNLLFNTTTTVLTSAKTSTTSSFSNYKITQLFLNLMTNKLNLMNYPIYGEDNKTNIKNKTLKVYKPLFTYGKKQTLIQHKLHQLRDLRVTIGAKYSSKYQFYSTQNENNLTNYHDMIILFLTSNFTFVEYQLLSKLAINNNILLLCGTSNMCNFDQFNYQLQNLN